jgi:hypothetical protein
MLWAKQKGISIIIALFWHKLDFPIWNNLVAFPWRTKNTEKNYKNGTNLVLTYAFEATKFVFCSLSDIHLKLQNLWFIATKKKTWKQLVCELYVWVTIWILKKGSRKQRNLCCFLLWMVRSRQVVKGPINLC